MKLDDGSARSDQCPLTIPITQRLDRREQLSAGWPWLSIRESRPKLNTKVVHNTTFGYYTEALSLKKKTLEKSYGLSTGV